MDIFEIFKIWGIAGIIAAASVWLLKNVFDQILKKDIDNFKYNLEKGAIEFKIKYEKLHTERAEVVRELYKKISRTYRAFHSYMNPLQLVGEDPEKVKAKKATRRIINNNLTFFK